MSRVITNRIIQHCVVKKNAVIDAYDRRRRGRLFHFVAMKILYESRIRCRKIVGSPYLFGRLCPGTTSKSKNATTFNNGTNMRRTACPDQPMSWNLDRKALSTTTEVAMSTSACDQCGVRPVSIGMFANTSTVASTIAPPKMDATHQNRSSSLPIRLDITISVRNPV